MRRILCFCLLLLGLMGCGKAPDLSGRWNMVMGPTTMQIVFGADGRYSGTMNGMAGVGQVSGGYKVKGNMLEMDPPAVTGPGGRMASPTGGTMRVKMIPQGGNTILLDAGNQKFTLQRMGPA